MALCTGYVRGNEIGGIIRRAKRILCACVFGNNVELPLVLNSLKMKDFLMYRSRLSERSVQGKYWPARSRQLGLSCFREFFLPRHKGQYFSRTDRAKEEYLLYGLHFSNMKEALSKLY